MPTTPTHRMCNLGEPTLRVFPTTAVLRSWGVSAQKVNRVILGPAGKRAPHHRARSGENNPECNFVTPLKRSFYSLLAFSHALSPTLRQRQGARPPASRSRTPFRTTSSPGSDCPREQPCSRGPWSGPPGHHLLVSRAAAAAVASRFGSTLPPRCRLRCCSLLEGVERRLPPPLFPRRAPRSRVRRLLLLLLQLPVFLEQARAPLPAGRG